MDAEKVYEIARYDVGTDDEGLVEKVQLWREQETLQRSVDDGPKEQLADGDAATAIAAEPLLNEVKANQVTRVTALPEVVNDLPFVLTVPGDRDDFNESLWTETMLEHVEQEWVVQPGRLRVLYVNGERWAPFPTADGKNLLLPEDWPTVRLSPQWASWGCLRFVDRYQG